MKHSKTLKSGTKGHRERNCPYSIIPSSTVPRESEAVDAQDAVHTGIPENVWEKPRLSHHPSLICDGAINSHLIIYL